MERNGAQGRIRTTDTVIFSHVLYQLSYLGTCDRPNLCNWASIGMREGAYRKTGGPCPVEKAFGASTNPTK